MQRLKLPVKLVRALDEKHGVNLLRIVEEDGLKMANLDFLLEVYFEGSREWENPPSKESLEDLDLHDLIAAVKGAISGDAPGKD